MYKVFISKISIFGDKKNVYFMGCLRYWKVNLKIRNTHK